MKVLILLILPLSVFAQTRQSLFKKPEAPTESSVKVVIKEKKSSVKKSGNESVVGGNLPAELMGSISPSSIEENPIVLPTNKSNIKFRQLKTGDVIQATIEESAFAFPDSKTPIRVRINSGFLKGSILLGEAALEKNSKRIIVDLKKFKPSNSEDVYSLQASVLDFKGIQGLEGKLVSNEDKFFIAEFLAAGAAGYADSTIERNQTILGNQSENRNEDTFAKKALVSALSRTADRFAEKLKQSPEYSILQGPVEVQILITEQPKLTND